mgnify:CR=1 FL=1
MERSWTSDLSKELEFRKYMNARDVQERDRDAFLLLPHITLSREEDVYSVRNILYTLLTAQVGYILILMLQSTSTHATYKQCPVSMHHI